MLIPLVFLLLSTLAIIVNISGDSPGRFRPSPGNLYITRKLPVFAPGTPADPHPPWPVSSCLYFLALSTPMTDILNELRKLRIPALLLELMMLTYRFIFVLLEIASSILTPRNPGWGTGISKHP